MSAYDPILARLLALHPKRIDLSLDRMWRILDALGHPERQLPPVIHVAGTNGKGSTIAFMRAMLEAAGLQRARLHLAASGALQRALSARCAGRRRAGLRRGAGGGARGVRARQRRRADHRVRDRDRGGLSAVRAPSGRRAAARSRARRPARRHQRDRDGRSPASITPVSMDHLGISRRHAREDRRREGGDPQARRAGGDRAADRRGAGGDRARGQARARAAAGRRASTGACTPSAAGWSIRTTTGCSICRLPKLAGRHQFDNAGTAIAALRAAGLALPPRPSRPASPRPNGRRACSADARTPEGARAGRRASCGSTAATTPTAAARSRRRWPISRSACRARWCWSSACSRPRTARGFLRNFAGLRAPRHRRADPDQDKSAAGRGAGGCGASGRHSGRKPRHDRGRARAVGRLELDPPPRILITGSLYLAGEVLARRHAAGVVLDSASGAIGLPRHPAARAEGGPCGRGRSNGRPAMFMTQ